MFAVVLDLRRRGAVGLARRRDRRAHRRIGPLDRRGHRAAILDRQEQRERAPGARLARDRDVSAEEAGELARDGEPEAGAAILTMRASVGLAERVEDDVLLFRRDADAGVRHRKRDLIPASEDAQRHSALGGELERVGDQVLQDLLQAPRIGLDHARRAFRDLGA